MIKAPNTLKFNLLGEKFSHTGCCFRYKILSLWAYFNYYRSIESQGIIFPEIPDFFVSTIFSASKGQFFQISSVQVIFFIFFLCTETHKTSTNRVLHSQNFKVTHKSVSISLTKWVMLTFKGSIVCGLDPLALNHTVIKSSAPIGNAFILKIKKFCNNQKHKKTINK